MKKTIKHYNMDNLISQNCDFNIMFGERSNGKSYQLKHKRMILNYLKTGNRFILLRRFKEEITASNIEQYFQDVDITPSVFGGNKSFYQIIMNQEKLFVVKK